jgi:hypothetical protein
VLQNAGGKDMGTASRLYEDDFHAWTQEQAALLRAGRLAEIDAENLAEEISEMGSARITQIENRLGVLLAHLLKCEYQPDKKSSGWLGTILEQRNKIDRLIRKNPSVKLLLEEALRESYADALAIFYRDTGIPPAKLPLVCPWSLEQVLDRDFLP